MSKGYEEIGPLLVQLSRNLMGIGTVREWEERLLAEQGDLIRQIESKVQQSSRKHTGTRRPRKNSPGSGEPGSGTGQA